MHNYAKRQRTLSVLSERMGLRSSGVNMKHDGTERMREKEAILLGIMIMHFRVRISKTEGLH